MIVVFILVVLWGGVSAYHLVQGLRLGAMRCFYSIQAADAVRSERPVRFWIYAGVNAFIVLACLVILAALWAGMTPNTIPCGIPDAVCER